jgi:hypothetical protein
MVFGYEMETPTKKLQEDGAAVTDLFTDIETDRATSRKLLEESCKKMDLLSLN